MIAGWTSRFAEGSVRGSVTALVVIVAVLGGGGGVGCGVFATARDQDTLSHKSETLEKTVEEQKQELAALKADLQATRERLDNALRANADAGTDLMSEKARINALAGRLDESTHQVDELRREVAQSRTEIDARLDEVKRAQAVQPQQPPPITIPADKGSHYAAIESAYAQKDFNLTRALGREYVNRYPTDDKADDVEFIMGDADLKDGRPSSALGEFNRVLKVTPPSNVLDKTLFDMGEAYMMMHDCASAKLAYESYLKRFPKEKVAAEVRARLSSIERPAAGTCAPQ